MGMAGQVNIKAGTQCQAVKEKGAEVILHRQRPVCLATSENGHQFFAYNDDGQGMLRGKLTQAIQKKLQTRDAGYQARWDRVWQDGVCQAYKRIDHGDFWLWNHAFFTAPIGDLQHIWNLVQGR